MRRPPGMPYSYHMNPKQAEANRIKRLVAESKRPVHTSESKGKK